MRNSFFIFIVIPCLIHVAQNWLLSFFYPNPKLHICKIIGPVTPVEPTEPNVSDFHFCHFDRWLQNDGLLCPSLIVTNRQANKQNKNTMSRRQRGRAVRALDLQFGGPELKSRHDCQLDFLGVAPILACTQTLFYFSYRSFGKHRRARE